MSLKRLLLTGLVCGLAPMAPASTLDINSSDALGFRSLGFSSSRVHRAACNRTKVNCMALNRTKPQLALTGPQAANTARLGFDAPKARQFAGTFGKSGLDGAKGGASSGYRGLLISNPGGDGSKDGTQGSDQPPTAAAPIVAAVPVPAAGLMLALALGSAAVFVRSRQRWGFKGA